MGVIKGGIYPALLVLLLPVEGMGAEAYKWTDSEGITHYSDQPADKDAIPVEILTTPAPDPVMEKRRRKRLRLLETFDEDRKRRQRERKAVRRERERVDKRCTNAKQLLQATLNAGYLYEKTDDPDNPRILSTEERQTETEKLRQLVDLWCG